MLHRSTLMPSAMRTTDKNDRSAPSQLWKESELCFSPFDSNEEIVVVEPTDPDEDRLREKLQHQQLQQSRCVEKQVTSPIASVSASGKQTSVAVRRSPYPRENFSKATPPNDPPTMSTLHPSSTISSVPLRSISSSKLNVITPSVPTVWFHPPMTTNGASVVMTSDSASNVDIPQTMTSLHPLIAAVLINCATVNMITQLTTSLDTPLYVSAPMGSDNVIPVNNLIVNLPTLLSNCTTDATFTMTTSPTARGTASIANTAALDDAANAATKVKNVPSRVKSDTPVHHDSTGNLCFSSARAKMAACIQDSMKPSFRFRSRVKQFKCSKPDCPLIFYNRYNQIEHIRTHTGERPFVCTSSNCSAAFIRCRDLQNHVNSHSLPDPMPMDTKDKSNMEGDGAWSKIRTRAVTSVPIVDACKVNVPTKTNCSVGASQMDSVDVITMDSNLSESNAHASFSFSNPDGTYQTTLNPTDNTEPKLCDPQGCDSHKTSHSNATGLWEKKNNLRTERDMRHRHVCPYVPCDKTYLKLNKLKEHLRSHTGERPYVCRVPGCGAAFVRLYGVRRHELIHSVGRRRSIRPNRLSFSFTDKIVSEENTSLDVEHDVGQGPSAAPSAEEPAPPASVGLKTCIEYVDPASVSVDQKSLKPDEPIMSVKLKIDAIHSVSSTNVPKRVLPAIAPKTPLPTTFRPLSPLTGTPGVRRPHICPFEECSKAFPKLNKLREHICRHTGERPFVCDICNASFVRMYDLRRHGKIHLRMADARKNSRHLAPKPQNDDYSAVSA